MGHERRASTSVDFGIITVREEELAAVVAELPPHGLLRGRRLYNLSRVETVSGDTYEIAIVRSLEPGTGEAAEVARDLIEELAPRWILVVGIGAGVLDAGVGLGDVVISSRIVDFTAEKVGPDGEHKYAISGGSIAREAAMVVANLPALMLGFEEWNQRSKEGRRFTAGVIASSDRIVNDAKTVDEWRGMVRGLRAIEMESAGVYRVASARDVPLLAIRGIAEIIGVLDRRDRLRAAHAAARFTAAFLRAGPIQPRPKAKQPKPTEGPISPRARSPFQMTRVSLTDVRGFDHLEIPLAPAKQGSGQWLIFLGDNGTGKTSILRALALAFSSDEVVQALLGRLGKGAPMVRLQATQATIQIECPSGSLPRLVLGAAETGDRLDDRGGGEVPVPFTVAYGCRRGSALGGAAREVNASSPLSAVESLFDEGAGLVHAETWLRERKLAATMGPGSPDEAFFDAVIATLVEVLPGVKEIHVSADAIEVEGPSVGRVPLGALSDGYLTTTGWVIDLIARWSEDAKRRGTALDKSFRERMTGVAIIDEIDLHLHPLWQRDVITGVRGLFPNMSFVVTTHNPMSLLGARSGEIYVLRRDERSGRVVVEQRDLPLGAGAERILTGEWFGLASTLDDDTLKLLDKHRGMLRKGSGDSPAAKKLEAELTARLGSYAATSMERLAQSAAAEVLDEEIGTLTPEDRALAKKKIADLLRKPAPRSKVVAAPRAGGARSKRKAG